MSDRLLGPWPCTGSLIVVPDSVALGWLLKPLGAQPSNPWTVTGSVPFYRIFWSLQVRAWVACPRLGCRRSPRASARSERAVRGPPDFFVQPSHILFVRTEGFFAEPTRVRAWVAGSQQNCRESPEPLHGVSGRSGVPLAFCTPLAHEGLFAEPPSGASLGHGVSAYL